MPLKVKSVESGWVKGGKFSPARGASRASSNPLPAGGRFVPARAQFSGNVHAVEESSIQ